MVHGHGTEFVYGRCAVSAPFPSVITLQTWMLWIAWVRKTEPFYWYSAWHELRTIRRAKSILCKTGFSERVARRYNPRARIRVVPNIVHPSFFAPEAGPARRGDYFVFAGTLRRDKGVFDLLRAYAQLPSPRPPLRVCGTGRDRGRMEALASRLGLSRDVSLLGQVPSDELAAIVRFRQGARAAHALHNSPNVVTEALAARHPSWPPAWGDSRRWWRRGSTGTCSRRAT